MTILDYEGAADRDVHYEFSIVTHSCADCNTPQSVIISINGSKPDAILSKSYGGFAKGSTRREVSENINVGYPCSLTIEAQNDDGWAPRWIDVTYHFRNKTVSKGRFQGMSDGKPSDIGWIDNAGCLDPKGGCKKRIVYPTPDPDACSVTGRRNALGTSSAAPASATATLAQPQHMPDQNSIKFAVTGNVQKGQGKVAKLVLSFFTRSGSDETPVAVNPYFANTAVEQTVVIQSNSQPVKFDGLRVSSGAIESLAARPEAYQLRVRATLSIDGNTIAESIPLDFKYESK